LSYNVHNLNREQQNFASDILGRMKIKTKLNNEDLYPHIKARVLQRGIAKEEIEKTFFVLLTAKARYGKFPARGGTKR